MRISDWSADVCSSDLPNGRAFDEALDPSAPPASFAQQKLPGAEILAGREEALVHRQTVLAPGVHVRGPGLYAVHHQARDLFPDSVDAALVGGALLDETGSAWCRVSVFQSGLLSEGSVALKHKKNSRLS